jgi:hypothetical protein
VRGAPGRAQNSGERNLVRIDVHIDRGRHSLIDQALSTLSSAHISCSAKSGDWPRSRRAPPRNVDLIDVSTS